MRKFFVCSLFIAMISTRVMAQPNGDGQADIVRWEWTPTNTTAVQIVSVPNGKGQMGINKLGSKLLVIQYTDAAGQIYKLNPVKRGMDGAPESSCKSQDECFASKDKKVGLCICKLADAGNDTYAMTLKFSPWIVRNK